MKIYVCVKNVPDSAATIVLKGPNEIDENITFLMNPYDEHAVSEAGRIKATIPGSEIIAVCLGKPAAEKTLRSALAMGADRGILITGDRNYDAMTTARALKAAIENDASPDLILTGKESIDCEGMQTMFRLARHFDMPAATNVVAIDFQGDSTIVTCEKEAGAKEIIKLRMPCLLAAGKGLNAPQYPTFPDIVKSRNKEIRTVAIEQLKLPISKKGVEIISLRPAAEKRTPKKITGTTTEIVQQLVSILRNEAKVI